MNRQNTLYHSRDRQNTAYRSLIRSSWQSIGFYRTKKRRGRRRDNIIIRVEWRH